MNTETIEDLRAKTAAISAADPVVQRELFQWFEAAQALGVENAGLRNSLQMQQALDPDVLAAVMQGADGVAWPESWRESDFRWIARQLAKPYDDLRRESAE